MLRSLIATLALALPVYAVGPVEAVKAAAADLHKIDDDSQKFMRYFWHPTPYYTAPPAQAVAAGILSELYEFDPILRFHVNFLSSAGDFGRPEQITLGVWRIDIRDYKWKSEVWEKMLTDNIYFNERKEVKVIRVVKGKKVKKIVLRTFPSDTLLAKAADDIAYLIAKTGSRTPIVNGPWFLANTSRSLTLRNKKNGYGYYDWFGVKVPNDFLKLLKIRLQDAKDGEREILEVVDFGGVSQHNRMIELFDALVGLVASTRDTDDETGFGNAIANLDPKDYKAKAREWYFPLWNRLFGLMLSDDAIKELQDVAPDFIGIDNSPLNKSPHDGRIHVGIACIRCHAGEILQPVKGWARENLRFDRMFLNVITDPQLFVNPQKQFLLYKSLERRYIKLNFANRINEQRLIYRTAVQDVSGMDAGTLARRYATVYHAYVDTPVTPDEAARGWGVPTEVMVKAFDAYGGLEAVENKTGPGAIAFQLAALAKGRSIKRLHYEDNYASGAYILLNYKEGAKP